jgi:hypothetical protein
MEIKRTPKDIESLRLRVAEGIDSGETRFPNMSYEQGIEVVLDWLLDEDAENPVD